MNLNSCVCATVERHTKTPRQNNNFCFKGIVCSTHCWRLTSPNSWLRMWFCVCGLDGFPKPGQLFVWLWISGKTADTGGESVRPVIYRDLLCLALCCGLPLGHSLLSHIMLLFLACYSVFLITMTPDLQSGKPRWVPPLEQIYSFPT